MLPYYSMNALILVCAMTASSLNSVLYFQHLSYYLYNHLNFHKFLIPIPTLEPNLAQSSYIHKLKLDTLCQNHSLQSYYTENSNLHRKLNQTIYTQTIWQSPFITKFAILAICEAFRLNYQISDIDHQGKLHFEP